MKKTALLILVVFAFAACTQPLSEEDLLCQANEDCQDGFACNAAGACVLSGPLVITTDSLADGVSGFSYGNDGANMEASGGLGSLTWTLSLSSEPGWLSLSKTGEFSSATESTIAGNYTVTVGVTDQSNRGNGQFIERDYTLNILGCNEDILCWIGKDDACVVGTLACVNGSYEACAETALYSSDIDHCGPDCNPCDTTIADTCSAGICGCSAEGPVCTGNFNCCDDGSGGICANILTEPAHCGSCGFDCAVRVLHVGSPATCTAGVCGYDGECADGWHDCDGDRSNGCETEQGVANCGFCEDNCATGPNSSSGDCDTDNDRCVFVCEGHFEDCDSAVLGCETNLTEAATCGDCPGGNVTDCTAFDPDLVCLYDSVNTEYYCGCDIAANHQGNNQDNPDGNVVCGDTQICCDIDGKGTCVEHDAEHCFDCGIGTPSVCNPFEGGIYCETAEAGGPWGCTCYEGGTTANNESCRNYDFSFSVCNTNTEVCQCGTQEWGCLEPEACCFTGANLNCTDLSSDALNCGMCGAGCAKDPDRDCVDGACECSVDDACPSPSGAPDCITDKCGCFSFNGQACPIGQYCVTNRGCCPFSDSPVEDCSIACINAGNDWCDDGTCAAPGECP